MSGLRLPSLPYGGCAVLHPWPLNSPVEGLRKLADLNFALIGTGEIGTRRQYSGEQERGIDGRQFRFPHASAGLHIKKMVIETLVTRNIPAIALRTGPKKAQRHKRAL